MRSFITIIFIPILFLGGFIIYNSINYVKNEKQTEVKQVIKQNILDLNNRLEQCEKSLIYITSNYTLQQFLQMDRKDYVDVIQASKNVGPLLYNVVLSNQYFAKIRVYANETYSVMDDLIKSSQDVMEAGWYQQTLKSNDTCWWYEGDKIFISRRIATAYPDKTIGVIYIEIKPILFRSSFNVFQNIPVSISMDHGINLYESSKYMEDTKDYIQEAGLISSDWKLEYQVNYSYFYPEFIINLILPTIILVLVLLIAAALATRIMLRLLLKEMDFLVAKVNEVKKGNLEVVIEQVKTEEINILVDSINNMLRRIRQLIQKVYAAELETKSLELNLLQSKISPHFLYNNLSAINWIAIEQGQDQIYEITTQMAMFYRTALNKGNNIDKLSVEIANIKAYVNLQLISHDQSFDVEYEIDESLLNCYVPIFILQPLVENAIEYGVDSLREGRGIIVISVAEEEGNLNLGVTDNGKELYKKIGNALMPKEDYGYGTSNVHKRIQLLFGENYGLTIYAREEGTVALLKLKLDENKIISENIKKVI